MGCNSVTFGARFKGQQKAGLHSRWHVGRGIKKPDCLYCFPEGPPPVAETERIPQALTDTYEITLWKQRVLELAAVACPPEVACKILGLPIVMFVAHVQQHFKTSWVELTQQAKMQTLVELQVQAIKQVSKGRDKLILLLDKQGLMPALGEFKAQAKGEGDFDPSKLSDAELTNRLKAALQKRVPGWQLSPTLSIEDPKPGDGLTVGRRQSHGRDEYDRPELPVSSEPRADLQAATVETFEDRIHSSENPIEPEQKPVTAHTGVNQDGSPAGPVVARPKPGIHVLEDHIMANERVGILKKEMIESLR
jgi:hypothetical protein